MGSFIRHAVAAATAAGLMSAGCVAAQASDADTTRIAGSDRYRTSVALSQRVTEIANADGYGYDGGDVYIASAVSFPDGLAAGARAARAQGRLLLVPRDGIVPRAIVDELNRLEASSVTIVGGTGAVTTRIEAQLKQHVKYVFRDEGTDRYATAATVGFTMSSDTAFLASGLDYPDALAGGAVAGHMESPLLLTAKSVLPAPTREALAMQKPANVVVLGGPGVVNDAIIGAVRKVLPKAKITRAAGANRYETAAAVSRYGYPAGASTVYLASGRTYADALPGSAAAGGESAPLLLTEANCVPRATLKEIERLGARNFVVVGGPGVLTQRVMDRVPC